jgi:methylenetetrahydrofolate reductase (NADPH)
VKHKVETGAEYIVTQMFFDNDHYFAFVDECRRQGITVPIIPGIKILKTKGHLTSLPKNFHCDIPPALADAVAAAEPEQVPDVGVAWAIEQSQGLLAGGVASLHFYVMSGAGPVTRVLAGLDL